MPVLDHPEIERHKIVGVVVRPDDLVLLVFDALAVDCHHFSGVRILPVVAAVCEPAGIGHVVYRPAGYLHRLDIVPVVPDIEYVLRDEPTQMYAAR